MTLFTPSTLFKDKSALKVIQQKVMNLYRAVDGAWEPEEDAPPLTLLDGILAEFVADLKLCIPGQEDEQLVWELGRAMCATFPSEKQRVERFWEIMMEHIQIFSAFQYLKLDSGETDGSLCVSGGLLVNLEAKNEIGSGNGCCHVQNAAHALLYVCQNKMDSLRNVSRCPTILIELAGPNLSFSAFAYTH